MPSAKRRLPLLPTSDAATDPPRPRWQWVAFGTLGIFVAWLPLQEILSAVAARAAISSAVAAAAALAIASFCGGFLLGRWGSAGVGARDAALAGLLAAAAAAALGWWTLGGGAVLLYASAGVAAIAVPMAALGGTLGLRRRAQGHAS
ncbi:MAG TPA: hypothetical protein VKU41_01370 [Polyangiaceae bacterium]|nr:hypothetical protein [Polyangiaceae bacterium]